MAPDAGQIQWGVSHAVLGQHVCSGLHKALCAVQETFRGSQVQRGRPWICGAGYKKKLYLKLCLLSFIIISSVIIIAAVIIIITITFSHHNHHHYHNTVIIASNSSYKLSPSSHFNQNFAFRHWIQLTEVINRRLIENKASKNLNKAVIHKIRPLHIDVSPVLQQVSEAPQGVGRAPGRQNHVNRPATLEITAVDPPQPGLHQELNSSQLAMKAGHVERWQTLESETQVIHRVMYVFLTDTAAIQRSHQYFLHLTSN